MTPFLFSQSLGEGFHQLFPATHRLDQLLIFFTQGQFRQLVQPFQRHLGADHLVEQRLQPLEMTTEDLIETIVMALVLHQRRPRQVVELFDAVRGDPLTQRLQ